MSFLVRGEVLHHHKAQLDYPSNRLRKGIEFVHKQVEGVSE